MAPKLSVVINAQNAEADLPRCLASIKKLAGETVVIDQGSTDKTAEIAKKFGAKVFQHKSVEYVELTRNFGISKASGDWIFILDPDEEVSPALAKKIKEIIKKSEVDYCRIPRKNIIFRKWIEHTLWWPDYQIRLFKKGKVSWNEVIHTVPMTTGIGNDIEVNESLSIIHHNYDSVEQYLEKLNRYTSVQAKLGARKFDKKDIFNKPLNEFINRFFKGEGYKDGMHGFLLSLLQAFSELIVVAKIWQAEKFKDQETFLQEVVNEMKAKEKELHYWQHDAIYKETGSLSARIKRKLRV